MGTDDPEMFETFSPWYLEKKKNDIGKVCAKGDRHAATAIAAASNTTSHDENRECMEMMMAATE